LEGSHPGSSGSQSGSGSTWIPMASCSPLQT
jgi:hypothetical protein